MTARNPLEVVSVRDLSRNPGDVLERVTRGERFLVCRHGKPIATLQPLDGLVVQPLTGQELDSTGSPLGDASTEAAKLTELQRELLATCVRFDRLMVARLRSQPFTREATLALEDLRNRGLVRKTERGLVLTGRGMILHEYLASRLAIDY